MRWGADMTFTPTTLQGAVRWVFEANGYDVDGPMRFDGASVDLVAKLTTGFTVQTVYVEVTTERVDVGKLGKDLTKLALFSAEPQASRLIVSSKGFTEGVRERAKSLGVETLTYDELFRRFETVDPYVRNVLDGSELANGLMELERVYQEPEFRDIRGRQLATSYLNDWWADPSSDATWLIVVGEYGTGKTALTRILQRRWTEKFRENPSLRLPLRI